MLKRIIKGLAIDTAKVFAIVGIILAAGYYSGYFDFACGTIVGMSVVSIIGTIRKIRRTVREIKQLRRGVGIRPAVFPDDKKPIRRGVVEFKLFGRNQGKSLIMISEMAKMLETDDVVVVGYDADGLRTFGERLTEFGIVSRLIDDDAGPRLVITKQDNPGAVQ